MAVFLRGQLIASFTDGSSERPRASVVKAGL
jgi:hypothetical protein